MPGKAAKVIITERQQEVLHEFSRSRSEPSFLTQRATLILLAFAGLLNEQIGVRLDLERHQVGIWRSRWAGAFDRLVLIECMEGVPALRQAIRGLLADAPRPGAPCKFTAEQLTQIFSLACTKPEDSGRPVTHWTHADLADEVRKRGIVESISVRHLGRLLDEADLKPHRIRYWLNAKEKDDPTFVPQVQLVCATYAEAPELYEKFRTHTISTDEMTGIQALARIARDYALAFHGETAVWRRTSSKKAGFHPANSRVPLIPSFGLPLLIRACANFRRVVKFLGPLPTRN